jgi:hypothetical protein
MAKQAKISIIADIGTLQQKVEQAKQLLSSVGKVNIGDDFSRKMNDMISEGLQKNAEKIEAEISGITESLKEMSKASEVAFDAQKAEQLVIQLGKAKAQLKEIKDVQKQIGDQGGVGGVAGGGRGRFFDRIGGIGSTAARAAGVVGIGLGVGALYNQRLQISRENMAIRQLTGGATVGRESEFGFTPQERRQRALGIVRGVGADMTGEEINRLTDATERLERAYGISAEESGAALGAARRAGVEDQEGFLINAVSAAVISGMDGSRIGEFLQSITSYMESMAEGITVDNRSLIGLAGALSEIPFFRDNSQRTIATLEMLNDAFRSGDRFQQALSSRAIMGAAGRAVGPYAVEMRRQLGLFGGFTEQQDAPLLNFIRGQAGGEDLAAGLATGGASLFQARAQQALQDTEGMQIGPRMFEFIQRMGMGQSPQGIEAGIRIFAEMVQNSGKLTSEAIEKAQSAMVDPQKRLENTFQNMDGRMLDLNASVQQLTEVLSDRIAIAALAVYDQMKNLTSVLQAIGINRSGVDMAADLGTGAVIGGGLAAFGGGTLLKGLLSAGKGGLSTLGRGASALGRGAMGLGRGAMGLLSSPLAMVGGAGALGYGAGHLIRKGFDTDPFMERLFASAPFIGMSPEDYAAVYGAQGTRTMQERGMEAFANPIENARAPALNLNTQNITKEESMLFDRYREMADALMPLKNLENLNNKGELQENTSAIQGLTEEMRSRGRGERRAPPFPSGAKITEGRSGSGGYQ